MPASTATPTRSRQREVLVELGMGEPGDQPGAAEDPERLADDQAEHHAEHHRAAHQVARRTQRDAGRHQCEERHRHPGRDRRADGARRCSAGLRSSPGSGRTRVEQAQHAPRRSWRAIAALVHRTTSATSADRQVEQRRSASAGAGPRRTPRTRPRRAAARPRCRVSVRQHGDDHDHDQVVHHGQGEQEGPQRGRQVRADHRQHGQREGDVGGRRDRPAARLAVRPQVDQRCRSGRAPRPRTGRRHRARLRRGAPQGAHHELALELQAGDEEEHA